LSAIVYAHYHYRHSGITQAERRYSFYHRTYGRRLKRKAEQRRVRNTVADQQHAPTAVRSATYFDHCVTIQMTNLHNLEQFVLLRKCVSNNSSKYNRWYRANCGCTAGMTKNLGEPMALKSVTASEPRRYTVEMYASAIMG